MTPDHHCAATATEAAGRRPSKCIRRLRSCAVFLVLFVTAGAALAESYPVPEPVEEALGRLLDFGGTGGQAGPPFDPAAFEPVVDFVRQTPESARPSLAKREGAHGAFISYTLARPFREVVRYAYNPAIPDSALHPSSVNYAYWKNLDGSVGLEDLWRHSPSAEPLVVRGLLHESITPDLHTGAYYDYDLKRTIVLCRIGGQPVLLSVSNLAGASEAGKKGYIVGDDRDWNYVYSGEVGIDVMGLGWVRSQIYRFQSVLVYVPSPGDTEGVRIGVFQWLEAGWSNINMVRSGHIRKGLERQSGEFKALLESRRLPSADTLEEICRLLEGSEPAMLRSEVAKVVRHLRQRAEQDPSLRKKDWVSLLKDPAYVDGMNRHQLVSVLIKEYIKLEMGRDTPLDRSFWAALESRPGRAPSREG